MANPEMSSAQEQTLGAVPPQGPEAEVGAGVAGGAEALTAESEVAVAEDVASVVETEALVDAPVTSVAEPSASVTEPSAPVAEPSAARNAKLDQRAEVATLVAAPAAAAASEPVDVPTARSAAPASEPVDVPAARSAVPVSGSDSAVVDSVASSAASAIAVAERSESSEVSTAADLLASSRPDRPSAPYAAPEPRSLPLLARVLLADLGVAIVALVALVVIEVQRVGETGMSLRRQAYVEDLVVLFLVASLFGVVTLLLARSGRTRVAIVQAVVTALVLGVAITSAATGYPKPITVEQDQ